MNQNKVLSRKYILLAGDIIIMIIALGITLALRYPSEFSYNLFLRHLFLFGPVFILFITVYYINELYLFEFFKGKVYIFSKLIVSLTIGGLLATTFFYFVYNVLSTLRPQRVLFIQIIITLFLTFVWRILFFTYSKKFTNNILIIGNTSLTNEIIRLIEKRPQLGFTVKAIVAVGVENSSPLGIPVYNNINELRDICKKENIYTIVSVVNPREDELLLKNLFDSLSLKIHFFEASNFYEKISGKVPISDIGQIWFLENLNENTKNAYEIIKRVFDVIASLVILILTFVLFPIISLAIKLDSFGPIVFKQKRTGKNGKNFYAMKFRSMKIEAEQNGPQWATKNDPRVTRVGRFLRKSRLDEIPQLLNVLRGEMSLVGPRPERPEFIETLEKEIPFYKERLLVKPGLSGWAQVMGPAYGGSKHETMRKLQYDLFYIKNRSLAMDLSIVLKTIKIVLSGKGQ